MTLLVKGLSPGHNNLILTVLYLLPQHGGEWRYDPGYEVAGMRGSALECNH